MLEHPACAGVFQRLNIDFCCYGEQTVAAACEKRGLDVGHVVRQLDQVAAAQSGAPKLDPRRMSTPELVAHIVSRYHHSLREALPVARELAAKVALLHGERDPRLRAVEHAVTELDHTIIPHLAAEEHVVFPALCARVPDRERVAAELDAMKGDHRQVGEIFARLRSLTDGFSPSTWACQSLRALLRTLEALEAETFSHTHLEHHVLMRRFAKAMGR